MKKISTYSEYNPENFEEVKKFLHFSKKRWLSVSDNTDVFAEGLKYPEFVSILFNCLLNLVK